MAPAGDTDSSILSYYVTLFFPAARLNKLYSRRYSTGPFSQELAALPYKAAAALLAARCQCCLRLEHPKRVRQMDEYRAQMHLVLIPQVEYQLRMGSHHGNHRVEHRPSWRTQ